jgi:hypothetical protein
MFNIVKKPAHASVAQIGVAHILERERGKNKGLLGALPTADWGRLGCLPPGARRVPAIGSFQVLSLSGVLKCSKLHQGAHVLHAIHQYSSRLGLNGPLPAA